MTRQEAVGKVAGVHGVDIDYGRNKDTAHQYRVFVASLEALGLIKFDEPKTERQELFAALERGLMVELTYGKGLNEVQHTGYLTSHGAGCVLDFIESRGFKIVRAP